MPNLISECDVYIFQHHLLENYIVHYLIGLFHLLSKLISQLGTVMHAYNLNTQLTETANDKDCKASLDDVAHSKPTKTT